MKQFMTWQTLDYLVKMSIWLHLLRNGFHESKNINSWEINSLVIEVPYGSPQGTFETLYLK